MNAVVFTGPTLPAEAAAALLPTGRILPPARQGDVWRAVQAHRPLAIGLIDGVFLHEPAVWHREILWALSEGVHVFGAASMGALRAAELFSFGMRGVGRVFEAYRDGVWPGFSDVFEDDDEVAVVHAPAELGAAPLSEALVDLRDTLLEAEAEKLLSRHERDALFAALKTLPFPRRSFVALAEIAAAHLSGDRAARLLAWLPGGKVDRKRRDAEAMLLELAGLMHTDPQPFEPQFHFERVEAWQKFVCTQAPAPGAEETLVLEELRLLPDEFRQAALAALGRLHAKCAPSASDAATRRAFDRFRMANGLARRADIDAWRAENAADDAGFSRLIGTEAALDEALAAPPAGLDVAIVDYLRLAGRFAPLLRRARAKAAALADLPLPAGDADLDAALVWFAELHHLDLVSIRLDAGLAASVWREYAFRRRMA